MAPTKVFFLRFGVSTKFGLVVNITRFIAWVTGCPDFTLTGGVITFTPQSALDDFFGLLHRIRQAHTHPLWTCYVLPSVIGMIAKLVCGNEDPIAVYDRSLLFLFFSLTTGILTHF
jgi:hypothetical protein